MLDEAERSLHDALCVLTQTVKETRTVPGGGCTEIAMAAAIDAEVKMTKICVPRIMRRIRNKTVSVTQMKSQRVVL